MKKLFLAVAAIGLLATGIAAQAAVLTFTLNEVGSNLVGNVNGTLNTNALTLNVINYTDGGGISPGNGVLAVGSTQALWMWSGFTSGVSSFGTGSWCSPTTGAGDHVALNFWQKNLYISKDYVSGSALSGTSTWNDNNFENLFITPGTYTMTYNGGADSVVLNIDASVPEPSSILALMSGVIGLVGFVARRRKA